MLPREGVSKNRETELRRNLKLVRFTRSLQYSGAFIIPTIVGRWQASGVDLSDGLLLQASFSVTMFILDLPTGWLTELEGRQ